jgi:hypothetical protein
MIIAMATRNPSGTRLNKEECTEFQLHMTQLPSYDKLKGKLVDFTEQKLLRYLDVVVDEQQIMALQDLIARYRRGLVAVGWRKGKPVYVDATREK